MSSRDHACPGQGSPVTPSQVINTAGLANIHSIVGFKPKKFDLVHQTFSWWEVWSGQETIFCLDCWYL